MLLIGFTWVFIAMAAALIAPLLVPGKWEDSGPTGMFAASVGAFFGGTIGAVLAGGVTGYSSTEPESTTLGIILSIAGGIVGLGMYAADARRQVRS